MLLHKAFVSLLKIAVFWDVLMDSQTVSQVLSKVAPCHPKLVFFVMIAATAEVIKVGLHILTTNNTLHRVIVSQVPK